MNFAIPSGSRSWWEFQFPHTLVLYIFWCRLASIICERITKQSQKGQLTCFSRPLRGKNMIERKREVCHTRKKSEKHCYKHIVCKKITDIELEILNQHAATEELSRSEYLQKLFLYKEIYIHYEVVTDMEILRELLGKYGLTGKKAQELCLKFARKNFPGY